MVFIAALAVIQWVSLVAFFRTLSQMRSGALPRTTATLLSLGFMTAPTLLGAPMLIEISQVAAFDHGTGVSLGGDFVPLWFLGTGSVLTLLVYGFRLRRLRFQSSPGFFAVGANIIGIMIGVYMVFVVIDQLTFFAPSRKDAGMLNWGAVKQGAAIDDIHCDSDMMVVKGVDTAAATYRCPLPFQMIFGRFSGTPLVAWPGYTEGTSTQLATALRRMQAEAIKLDDHQK